MDQELFELCKKVYELTRWKYSESGFNFVAVTRNNDGDYVHRVMYSQNKTMPHWDKIPVYPLYTSDYLLEKLKRVSGDVAVGHWAGTRDKPLETWHATFIQQPEHTESLVEQAKAGTPLKALLKLTIVLHEAGELK